MEITTVRARFAKVFAASFPSRQKPPGTQASYHSYDTHLECTYHSELSLLYSWLHLN